MMQAFIGAVLQGGIIVVLFGGAVLIAAALWSVGRGRR
jgi:hypothetical protein